jgi:hypothetical protein
MRERVKGADRSDWACAKSHRQRRKAMFRKLKGKNLRGPAGTFKDEVKELCRCQNQEQPCM